MGVPSVIRPGDCGHEHIVHPRERRIQWHYKDNKGMYQRCKAMQDKACNQDNCTARCSVWIHKALHVVQELWGLQVAQSQCKHCSCKSDGQRCILCSSDPTQCTVSKVTWYTFHGYYMLLNNKSILRNVCTYLIAQSLGTVSPHTLCLHVNNIILPALRINGKIVKSIA